MWSMFIIIMMSSGNVASTTVLFTSRDKCEAAQQNLAKQWQKLPAIPQHGALLSYCMEN